MAVTLQETMRELIAPREYLEDIFAVNLDSLKSRGIKLLLIDVNNTILPADAVYPSLRTLHWFEQLQNYTFQTVLISSGWARDRLDSIARLLKVPVYYGVLKPILPAVRAILTQYAVRSEECAVIGDALWSDVLLAKLLGAYSILIKNCDQPLQVDKPIGLLRRAKAAILESIIHKKVD
ncbi:MAG: HAD hydrolase-like protein [Candidatus Margulisbacteria bacterium]|jgi:HAD superfamily phosphatase (TIGR01668 family)|nr:HAD hydrolase-like protein [Candidatus Margulisiibacteriota bacterium]